MSGIKLYSRWRDGGGELNSNKPEKDNTQSDKCWSKSWRGCCEASKLAIKGASACSEAGRNATDLLSLYKHDGICLARDCSGRWHTNASIHSFTHMHAPGAFVHFNESSAQKQEGKQRCHFWPKRLFFCGARTNADTRMHLHFHLGRVIVDPGEWSFHRSPLTLIDKPTKPWRGALKHEEIHTRADTQAVWTWLQSHIVGVSPSLPFEYANGSIKTSV